MAHEAIPNRRRAHKIERDPKRPAALPGYDLDIRKADHETKACRNCVLPSEAMRPVKRETSLINAQMK